MSDEHPILFRRAMVRRILDGRKTQTRRVITNIRHGRNSDITGWEYGKGVDRDTAGFALRLYHGDRAFLQKVRCPYGKPGDRLYVRETLFMPKRLARIWLEVVRIRVERIQDISVADCLREGIEHDADEEEAAMILATGDGDDRHAERFADLWDAINLSRGYPWDENPWVWVVTFQMPPFEPEPTRQIAWNSAQHEK